jgi:hypothetical protein
MIGCPSISSRIVAKTCGGDISWVNERDNLRRNANPNLINQLLYDRPSHVRRVERLKGSGLDGLESEVEIDVASGI